MQTFTHKPGQLIPAATFLAAVGNSKRLEILYLLSESEIGVGHLAEMTGLSQSALSQHLAKLRKNGLVKTRRVAQNIFYSCESAAVLKMLVLVNDIFGENNVQGAARRSEKLVNPTLARQSL